MPTCIVLQTSIPSSSVANQTPPKLVENNMLVTALGALLGLSVVLLAVVTTGWVRMYLYIHKE